MSDSGGIPGAPEHDAAALAAIAAEMDHLLYIMADLRALWPIFPPTMMAPLYDRYSTRYAFLHSEWQRSQGVAAPAEPAPPVAVPVPEPVTAPPQAPTVPAPAAAVEAAPAPRPAREPWLREFLTDHAIYILSYLGAFALIIATVLFEVYSADVGAVARFFPVIGMDALFLAAGLYCLGRDDLRIVGRSYLVIFAISFPLVCYSAYHFFDLSHVGINGQSALSYSALASAIVYGALARRVNAVGYAGLSLAALPIVIHGLVVNQLSSGWEMVALGSLLPAYWAIAGLVADRDDSWGLFYVPATVTLQLLTAIIALFALLAAGSEPDPISTSALRFPYLPLAMAEVAVGLVFAFDIFRTRIMLVLAHAALTIAVLVGAFTLRTDIDGAAIGLLGIATCDFAVGLLIRTRPIARVAMATAAAHVVAAAFLTVSPDWLPIAIVAEATAIAVAVSLQEKRIELMALAPVVLLLCTATQVVDMPAILTTPRQGFLPIGAALITVALSGVGFLLRRRDVVFAVVVGLSATTFTTIYSLAASADWYAAGAVAIAIVGTGLAWLQSRGWGWRCLQSIVAIHAVGAALLPGVSQQMLILCVCVAALLGVVQAALSGEDAWLGLGFAAVVVGLLQATATPFPSAIPRLLFVPIGCAVGTAAIGAFSLWRRRRDLIWAVAAGLSAIACGTLLSLAADANWFAATAVALAAVYVALTWLESSTTGRWILLYGAAAHIAAAAIAVVDSGAMPVLVVVASAVIALVAVLRTREVWWLLVGAAALGAELITQLSAHGVETTVPRLLFMPLGALAVTATVVAASVWLRRRDYVWLVNIGAAATAYSLLYTLAAGQTGYAWSGVALGAVGVALLRVQTAGPSGQQGRSVLSLTTAAHLVQCFAVTSATPGMALTMLLCATGVALAATWVLRLPGWVLLAAMLFADAWYWLTQLVLPADQAGSGPVLSVAFTVLAVGYTAMAVAIRRRSGVAGRRWAQPIYAAAGAIAIFALVLSTQDFEQTTATGWELLVFAAAIYATVLVEGRPDAVPMVVATIGLAAYLVLSAAKVDAWMYPIVFSWIAMIVVLAGEMTRWMVGEQFSEWRRRHALSAIAVAAVTVVVCANNPLFRQAQAPGEMASLAATIILAAIVLYESFSTESAPLEYVAAAIGALATTWLWLYLGFTDPQAFVALPGVTAVVLGIRLRGDQRPGIDRSWSQIAIVVGACLLMGTSELESLDPARANQATYVATLVFESMIIALLGIASRSRFLALAAAVGLALAAFRAVSVVVANIPLYAVFALAALLLLAVATSLAVARTHIASARNAAQSTWRTWS